MAALTVVWARQPGTCLYLAHGWIGERTLLGGRKEVPAELVRVVRAVQVTTFGIPMRVVRLEGDGGTVLLTHTHANYHEDDLSTLASRIGARFSSDFDPE